MVLADFADARFGYLSRMRILDGGDLAFTACSTACFPYRRSIIRAFNIRIFKYVIIHLRDILELILGTSKCYPKINEIKS